MMYYPNLNSLIKKAIEPKNIIKKKKKKLYSIIILKFLFIHQYLI